MRRAGCAMTRLPLPWRTDGTSSVTALIDIRLITVDLDDTLWPCLPVIQRAEQLLFDWLSEQVPRITAQHDIDSLRAHRLAVARQNTHLAHDLTELRRLSLAILLSQFGYTEDLAEPACELFRRARNRVEPYPEVRPTLQRLQPHASLISVTNGNAQVEQTPLAGSFDHSLSAAEVGAAKPDPALFRAAISYAGVSPGQALHVGDDPELDVLAARRIGMLVVWVNREQRPWPTELGEAPVTLFDISGLPDLLQV